MTQIAWRGCEADAHTAKADALQFALDSLAALDGAVDGLVWARVLDTMSLLELARERHEQAAAVLARA